MRTLLAALALLALPTVAAAAPVAFEDRNHNGVFDAGDVALSVAPNTLGCLDIRSDQDLVFPKGSIPATRYSCAYLHTTGHLTLEASVLVKMTPEVIAGDGTSLRTIWAKGKAGMTVGAGVTLESGGWQYIGSNFGLLAIGEGARFTSKYDYVDFIADQIEVGARAVVRARTRIQYSSLSTVAIAPGLDAIVSDPFGFFGVDARDDATIERAKQIQANGSEVRLYEGGALSLAGSLFKALGEFPYVAILDYILAPGVVPQGPVDLTGTRFPMGAEFSLQITGAPVIR